MKKIVSLFISLLCILSLTASLGISVSALPNMATLINIPKLADGKTLTIDGQISDGEGWGEPLLVIDETNIRQHSTKPAYTDFDTESIRIYYRWDETNFYFACQVEDPEHYNPENGGNNWKGDSIRFDLSHDVQGNQAKLDNTMKYWFSLHNDGHSIFFQERTEDGCPAEGGDASATFKVARNETAKTTTYELALHWDKNLPKGTAVAEGFTFISHQRVMERSSSESEPPISISFPGYDQATSSSGWWYATLVAADQAGGIPSAAAHKTVKVPASPASHASAGTKEHYACTHCDLLFADEAATILLLPSDVSIARVPHLFNPSYKSDDAEHWKSCSCGEEKDRATHEYGELLFDDDGHYQKCEICKHLSKTLAHELGNAVNIGEGGHTRSCECGFVSDAVPHTYGEWTTVTEATTEQVGQKKHACTVCGFEETAEIPVVIPAEGCGAATAKESIPLVLLLAGAYLLLQKKKATR